jgi:hypothetical protein
MTAIQTTLIDAHAVTIVASVSASLSTAIAAERRLQTQAKRVLAAEQD